jgi:hypothetical protein
MESTKRPGALNSDRAGDNVLAGTLPHTISNASVQHRESADDYHRVVAVLNDGWRVIECRDGIQWILQRRAGERHGMARWDSRSYCQTSEALNRVCRASAGAIDPAAVAVLTSLPSMIEPDGHALQWIAGHCQVSLAVARTIAEHANIGGGRDQ